MHQQLLTAYRLPLTAYYLLLPINSSYHPVVARNVFAHFHIGISKFGEQIPGCMSEFAVNFEVKFSLWFHVFSGKKSNVVIKK